MERKLNRNFNFMTLTKYFYGLVEMIIVKREEKKNINKTQITLIYFENMLKKKRNQRGLFIIRP